MEAIWRTGPPLTPSLDLQPLAGLHVGVSPLTQLPGAVHAGGGLGYLEDLALLG